MDWIDLVGTGQIISHRIDLFIGAADRAVLGRESREVAVDHGARQTGGLGSILFADRDYGP